MLLFLRTLAIVSLLALAVGAHAGEVLHLGGSDTREVQDVHVDILIDPTRTLGIDDVLAGRSPEFSSNETLQQGFQPAAVWLRLRAQRPPGSPSNWWMVFDQALIDDVRVYTVRPDGRYEEMRAGLYEPPSSQAVQVHRPAFRISLPDDDQPQVFYARLTSHTSLSVSLHFVQPHVYHVRAIREAIAFGAFFGFYALSVLCYLFFWYWTREVITGQYLVYLLFAGLGAALSTGYPQHHLLPGHPTFTHLGLVVALCGQLVVGMAFGLHILNIRARAPWLSRALMYAAGTVSLIGLAAAATGRYGAALALFQASMLVSMTLLTALAVVRAIERDPSAWAYLPAFSVLHAGLALPFLRNLGVAPVNAWTDYGGYVGITAHILIMSLAIFHRYTELRGDKERAQAAALEADLRALAERHSHREQREFMSMVSHEFRSPLAIIDVTVQNLIYSTREENDSRLPRYARIQRAAQRLTVLMNTYLSAERLEDGNEGLSMRECDLTQLLSAVLLDLDTTKGPEVKLEIDALDPLFRGDPDSLRILLSNLLENARRHSPEEAAVILRVSGRPADALEISVIDRGEGIPPDELPHLFQRFFRGRAAQRHPGAGLGLYLCQRIVHQHGGDITVSSAVGKGTEFKVWLPKRSATDGLEA